MVSVKNKKDTIAFLKRMCKQFGHPFTVFELTERMCGQRYNYPTTSELQHMLTKMDFIKVVDTTKTHIGCARKYIYVGD